MSTFERLRARLAKELRGLFPISTRGSGCHVNLKNAFDGHLEHYRHKSHRLLLAAHCNFVGPSDYITMARCLFRNIRLPYSVAVVAFLNNTTFQSSCFLFPGKHSWSLLGRGQFGS